MVVFEIIAAVFGLALAVLCLVLFSRRMRPRLVMTILILIEFFSVCIAFSPSVGFSMQSIAATREWRENPNPATERRMRSERMWNDWRPRIVWAVIAVDGALIVVYGTKLYRRRTA